jgi:hypothetical protein
MSYKLDQQTRETARVRNLFVAALVLGCAFGTVTNAAAQRVTPPTTPAAITPPGGNTALLEGNASAIRANLFGGRSGTHEVTLLSAELPLSSRRIASCLPVGVKPHLRRTVVNATPQCRSDRLYSRV